MCNSRNSPTDLPTLKTTERFLGLFHNSTPVDWIITTDTVGPISNAMEKGIVYEVRVYHEEPNNNEQNNEKPTNEGQREQCEELKQEMKNEEVKNIQEGNSVDQIAKELMPPPRTTEVPRRSHGIKHTSSLHQKDRKRLCTAKLDQKDRMRLIIERRNRDERIERIVKEHINKLKIKKKRIGLLTLHKKENHRTFNWRTSIPQVKNVQDTVAESFTGSGSSASDSATEAVRDEPPQDKLDVSSKNSTLACIIKMGNIKLSASQIDHSMILTITVNQVPQKNVKDPFKPDAVNDQVIDLTQEVVSVIDLTEDDCSDFQKNHFVSSNNSTCCFLGKMGSITSTASQIDHPVVLSITVDQVPQNNVKDSTKPDSVNVPVIDLT